MSDRQLLQPMRAVFGEIICEMGEECSNLVVLDADVSSSTQTRYFGDKYPNRFFNFGIAEANMVSAAAGMSVSGLIPVVSTFAFLIALRAGEQVRTLIAYNNLNVKLAGGYAGLSDFADGASHQSIIDIAVMRSIPNMTVIVPSDIETTRWAVKAMIEHYGPVYLRLSRDVVGSYHNGNDSFKIGCANVLRDGHDITIAVTGILLPFTISAAEELRNKGISAAIVEFPTVKPFDSTTLIKYVKKTGIILTIEEHSIYGGLGSAVAEYASEHGHVTLKRMGIKDVFGESGVYNQLLNKHQLTTSHITKAVEDLLYKRM